MAVSQEQRQMRELIARGQSKGFLTNEEVDAVQMQVRNALAKELHVDLR